MTDRRFAVGLIGCGRLAEAGYLPALAATSRFRLVAVADPDPGRRARVAAGATAANAGGVATYPDAAALLAGTPVDVVMLASPVATHLADARLAVAAGAAVLVEKPPAPDAAGAAALAGLDPSPWVSFNRRFDPGATAARAAVPATGYVDLRLEIHYRRRSWAASTVRDDVVLDLGPHLVDWALWLSSSEPLGVTYAHLAPDRADIEVTLSRGRARLVASADSMHEELIEIRDRHGRRLARHRIGGPVAAALGRLPNRGPHPLAASLTHQLDALARALDGGVADPLGTAREGLAVMRVIDAVRTCAARGTPISLVPPEV